jgi:hypothetical protein
MIGHRGLIPLEIGFWGHVSCVVLLLTVLVVFILDKLKIRGGGFLFPKEKNVY